MSSRFEIPRDAAGVPTYGVQPTGMRKFGIQLSAGLQDSILLNADEKYAIFLPTLGSDWLVSHTSITTYGTSFALTDAILNPGSLDLANWTYDPLGPPHTDRRIYLLALSDLQMCILLGTR